MIWSDEAKGWVRLCNGQRPWGISPPRPPGFGGCRPPQSPSCANGWAGGAVPPEPGGSWGAAPRRTRNPHFPNPPLRVWHQAAPRGYVLTGTRFLVPRSWARPALTQNIKIYVFLIPTRTHRTPSHRPDMAEIRERMPCATFLKTPEDHTSLLRFG